MLSFYKNKGNIDDNNDNSLSPQKFKKCYIDAITDNKDLTNVEAVLISKPV